MVDAPTVTRSGAGLLSAAVIVAALGYFVDIYDLILFNIVRIPSLTAMGVTGDALTRPPRARRPTRAAGRSAARWPRGWQPRER